jgi:integrase
MALLPNRSKHWVTTDEKKAIISPVCSGWSADSMANAERVAAAPTTVNSSVRRKYLTEREVERLMATARKSGRYGHRDATMILIAYRHGLRASEVCDLQWQQVELATGRLHVRRAKNGTPSVHPLQGNELRALRRLQREQEPSSHVFMTGTLWHQRSDRTRLPRGDSLMARLPLASGCCAASRRSQARSLMISST